VGSFFFSTCSLSYFGIRSNVLEPALRLAKLILQAYTSLQLSNELEWRLSRSASGSPSADLADYIRSQGPEAAVRNLILSSHPVATAVGEELILSISPQISESVLINRILWKIGFNLPRYHSYERVKQHLHEFETTILAIGEIRSEEQREDVRKAGVNLFVHVESFLEELLGYIVWLLSSDHFLFTNFVYDSKSARRSVGNVLGSSSTIDQIELRWNMEEGNSLGTLLHYLQISSEWTDILSKEDRNKCSRSENDLPHYADKTDKIFAYRHTQFWADTNPIELTKFAQGYSEIVRRISQSDLAVIRNGLDHWRDERSFPSAEKMLSFVSRFREAVQMADLRRYLPKWFWVDRTSSDRFGQIRYDLIDESGQRLSLYEPSFIHRLTALDEAIPLLVAPGNLLGYPNSEVIFGVKESSLYSEYWAGYPIRRPIPDRQPENSETRESDVLSAESPET
jgi:hypothetical protein